MTGERRYDDDEVRRIFEAASARIEAAATGASTEGMTLAELQEIGAEVGLNAERIARAAAVLDTPGSSLPRRNHLGLPVSVGHVADLPRAPTDDEWDLLVAALRETFGARGEVSWNGGIREWTNGNLHACVEPTESGGHRLRLGTLNGGAVALNFGGVVLGSLAIAAAVAFALSGRLAEAGPGPIAIFLVLAALALLRNAIRLPRWAREREDQMASIVRRAVSLLGRAPTSDPPEHS